MGLIRKIFKKDRKALLISVLSMTNAFKNSKVLLMSWSKLSVQTLHKKKKIDQCDL